MVSLAEAQRRIRAILAMVRSLARRTASNAGSVEEFEQHFDGRLLAFARSQAYAFVDAEPQVDLELIVREEVLALLGKDGGRIRINGASLRLSLRLAETFTLAVHELLTNAIKFGALAQQGGDISITWRICHEGEEDWLEFRWDERLRGEPVRSLTRRGFGSELLEDVMRYEHDAEPNLCLGRAGLTYSVRLPLLSGAGSRDRRQKPQ